MEDFNRDKTYIKTERFILDPHNGTGTRIVIPELKKKTLKKEKPPKWEGKLFTTESIEYYKKERNERLDKEKREFEEKYYGQVETPFSTPKASNHPSIKDKPWLIKPPNTILDDYVIFERLEEE